MLESPELAALGPFSKDPAKRKSFFSAAYQSKFLNSWVPRSPGQYFAVVSPSRDLRLGLAWEGPSLLRQAEDVEKKKSGDAGGQELLRWRCEMQTQEGVQYHWIMHDGANLGMQQIKDSEMGLTMPVAFVSGERGVVVQVKGSPSPQQGREHPTKRKGRVMFSLASLLGVAAGAGPLVVVSNKLGETVGVRVPAAKKVFLLESYSRGESSGGEKEASKFDVCSLASVPTNEPWNLGAAWPGCKKQMAKRAKGKISSIEPGGLRGSVLGV